MLVGRHPIGSDKHRQQVGDAPQIATDVAVPVTASLPVEESDIEETNIDVSPCSNSQISVTPTLARKTSTLEELNQEGELEELKIKEDVNRTNYSGHLSEYLSSPLHKGTKGRGSGNTLHVRGSDKWSAMCRWCNSHMKGFQVSCALSA